MIFFVLFSLGFVAALTLIRPAPASLKARRLTYRDNVRQVRGTIAVGLLILVVFLLISDLTFTRVNEEYYPWLALNNLTSEAWRWPYQALTHLVIHGDVLHLVSNLVCLGLASVYERKVGTRRFLCVLMVGALASIPSVFFYSEIVLVSGLSGGIFGLAAAFFTDEDKLSFGEWLLAILVFCILAGLFSLQSLFLDTNESLSMKVDHLGHAFGAIGAILYCRLRPNVVVLNEAVDTAQQ